MEQELFELELDESIPLAARMRPRSIAEIVGQEHVLGPDGLLTKIIAKHIMPSMILWGPPGSGKTTLAENIGKIIDADFIRISGVLGGVKEIRDAVYHAREVMQGSGRQTYLFIDEIHRLNRAQQDSLLPHVEHGVLTLIGATTENPSFSINTPLLSRCRVVVLKALQESELRILIERALGDEKRGLGARGLKIDENAEEVLVSAACGDARVLLSTLEIAADLVGADEEQIIGVRHVESAVGRRLVFHDRAGDSHYDVISAFIKSMRGSDPNASCHYLTRMLEGGEDPRFILRRMVIFASEDVGNADPQAIQVAVSALQAYELSGMPEGTLPLTQAATYLACAPKSNAVTKAYNESKDDLIKLGALPIPLHLCNAPTQLMKESGRGKSYKYPHDYEGNYVEQQYLPDKLVGKKYYVPTKNGYERFIAERMEKLK
jgi:putative ATPase